MGQFGNRLYGLGLRLGATIVDKIDWKFVHPLPPNQVWENGKWLVLAFAVFILDLGEGGGEGRVERMGVYVPLYSFQDGSLRNR